MAAIASFSTQSIRYWQHHLVNDCKVNNALKWNLHNESAMLPRKWVKGDLVYFQQNVVQLSLFQKNIFSFSHVDPFVHEEVPNEGIVKFLVKFGSISPSPWKQGAKVKNPITGY